MSQLGALHIGVDVGTSSIKFLVMNESLETLDECSVPYESDSPAAGWNEIDPRVWSEIVLGHLTEVCDRFRGAEIAGIGVTGQMHTTVFLDAQGTPVRPAILWTDRRADDLVPQLASRLSEHSARNARIVASGCMLASIAWLRRNEPEVFEQVAWVMTPKDYVVWSLTGEVTTDHSDASTSCMYDWEGEDWSGPVLEDIDLPARLLPPIRSSAAYAGTLSSDTQRRIGAESAIPVVAGAGDNVASALACGAFSSDSPVLSIGTSAVVIVPSMAGNLKGIGKNVRSSIVPGDSAMICQGSVGAGGKSLSWFVDGILGASSYSEIENSVQLDGLGVGQVLFFPHLNGEKIVYRDPGLRGAFYGLGLDTTRADMYQGVQEGVGYALRALYDRIRNADEPPFITLVGGGSKSRLWPMMLANIFNRPIRVFENSHDAVRGAALLSMIAAGVTVRVDEDYSLVEPEQELVTRYRCRYEEYSQFGDSLFEFLQGMDART
ncbi:MULTISPECIES: xylulokinase [unclassified Luteococcus]|uniref:xylulokinase n=1 Tax=unclassified Luteococcus TaxID=2639923 RepID=UPI00313C54C9